MKKAGLAGSFWPSEQQELILRTVLLDDAHARASWDRLVTALDLDHLEEGSYALMPQLYRRLNVLGIDAAELPRLKGIHRKTWYANQLFLDRAAALLRAFTERGVEPVVAGDAALLARVYPDTGAREIAQLEILFPAGDEDAVIDAAAQAGWNGARDRIAGLLRRRGAARLVDAARRPLIAQVKLLPEFSLDVPTEETFGATTRGEVSGLPARFLDPADELVRVCALGARCTFYRSVAWVSDAFALITAHDPSPAWDRVVAVATANRATLAVGDALRYLTDAFDVAVPSSVFAHLAAAPADKRDVLAHRLAGGSAGSMGAALAPLIRTSEEGLANTLRRAPAFLRDRLSLDRVRDVPIATARRKIAQVASRRRR